MEVAFLLTLVMAKRVDELQALSCRVASHGPDILLAFLSVFVAQTESVRNPLPRSFLVRSLEEFMGDLPEDCLTCPVRDVRTYLAVTSSVASRPCSNPVFASFYFRDIPFYRKHFLVSCLSCFILPCPWSSFLLGYCSLPFSVSLLPGFGLFSGLTYD